MNKVQEYLKPYMRAQVPPMRSGDVVRVHERIVEGGKERIQVFEGLIIARKHGNGITGTFTVRKIARGNIGVERTFPIHSPRIEKIEIVRHETVRRSKLYYVRDLIGKKVKRRKATPIEQMFAMEATKEEVAEPEEVAAEVEENVEIPEVKAQEKAGDASTNIE
ncbi:MAG: 50S ribosomal protein L19 [Candidatus Spechtbacteria bacterium]|nr:50S ribosomal protein L19 [Candidatus Spechtbacteria bacterium]